MRTPSPPASYLPCQPGFERQHTYQSLVVPGDSPIAGIVSDFYQFRVGANKLDTFTLPDGCADFMFFIAADGACVEGLATVGKERKAAISFAQQVEVFGVRFRPGIVKHILGVPAKSVINTRVPLADLPVHRGLLGKISRCGGFHERAAMLTDHIQATLISPNHNNITTIIYCVDRIVDTSGTITVQALSEETRYSVRYLQCVFADNLGFSPKQFSAFVKLQKSLHLVTRAKTLRLVEVALECGYYDQSHMNHSYKKLVGMVPKQFMSTSA